MFLSLKSNLPYDPNFNHLHQWIMTQRMKLNGYYIKRLTFYYFTNLLKYYIFYNGSLICAFFKVKL